MVDPKPPTPQEVASQNISKGSTKKSSIQTHPESILDIHNAYITPQTGRDNAQETLNDTYIMLEDGIQISLRDLFSAINSDIRLSNLTDVQETYVQWAVEMQLMCHQLKCPRSAYTSDVSRVSVTEPSLARNGFLAKNIQTIRQMSEHIQVEQNKPADRGFVAKLNPFK